MLNRPLTDFVDPVSRPLLDHAWLRRRHVHGEERPVVFLRADGSPVYGTVSANPIEDGDVYLGALVMVTDVSDRKHMAHDFSNAITAITGYSDLLLHDVPPDDPRHAALEQIKRAAESAVALTRQLAD
jgi:signal transduction histidine kinase